MIHFIILIHYFPEELNRRAGLIVFSPLYYANLSTAANHSEITCFHDNVEKLEFVLITLINSSCLDQALSPIRLWPLGNITNVSCVQNMQNDPVYSKRKNSSPLIAEQRYPISDLFLMAYKTRTSNGRRNWISFHFRRNCI